MFNKRAQCLPHRTSVCGDLEKIDRLLAGTFWLGMLKGLFILLILCLIGLLFGK